MSSDGDNSGGSAGGLVISEDHPRDTTSSCGAVNQETGDVCGETEGLTILDQFRRIYEERIEKVEQDEATGAEGNTIPMKLKIMKEWIKDLGEQNVMLVRTVEELEQAACYRVKMLEEKLKETAGIVSEKMSRITKPSEDTVNCLSKRIYELEKDEEVLQEKIEFLRSDIRGLLELIRRARCQHCWSLSGIKFHEIHPDDIPTPEDCSCPEGVADTERVEYLKRRLDVLGENEKKSRKCQMELQEKLMSQEEQIKKYILMVESLESLKDSLKKRFPRKNETGVQGLRNAGMDFELDIASIVDIVESAIAERSNEDNRLENLAGGDQKHRDEFASDEVRQLRAELENKSMEIERLSSRLNGIEKESLETREALINEVAEKHDMGRSLRAEVATLTEQCRRADMLIQLKEDIIKGMRKELKQRPSTKDPGPSGRRVRINADVVGCDEPASGSSVHPSEDRNGSNLVSDIKNAKASWKGGNEALKNLRIQLEEVLEELHAKERQECMASAHHKLNDIGTLLDNYKTEVIDRTDGRRELKLNEVTIQKLAKSIANISKIFLENSNGLIFLDRALEKSKTDHRATSHEVRVTQEFNERWKWDVFDRQFNAMEEYRVCTVEAQAATENLREEMEIVVGNLQTRHQRFLDLSNVVKKMHGLLTRTRENVSTVLCRLENQEQESISCNEKFASSEVELKDIKNQLNKTRSEVSRDVVDFVGRHKTPGPSESSKSQDAVVKAVEVLEQIVHNLRLLRTQDQCRASLLGELKNQLSNMECNLEALQDETNIVLSDNDEALKVYNEKILRLDKFERELDYAHTKMQETLESIVESKQRMIDVGVCNLCSCSPNDTATSGSATTSRDEDTNRPFEVQQLRNSIRSKDKLLEDKDEIIRIQKDSITMTQLELKDLSQKMQSKIDAQNLAICQHVEEKSLLLEQSKLQNQTIGHLREAVVEAKRCRATQQQPQQKSTIDMAVSECCDKNETIRVLTLYLKETQDQYNDCFAEAAEQGTMLELQRDAIQNLQRTIVRKDLVYYSILIKVQELFRAGVQDVRFVKSKIDDLVKFKKCLENKYQRLKRLWEVADAELKRIKLTPMYEAFQDENKDCTTCIDATNFSESSEIQSKIKFLLRENDDLKKQLQNRRIEFELFDEEVKNQLNENARIQELTKETTKRVQDSENCLEAKYRKLETVLKEHLAREKKNITIDSTPAANIDAGALEDELCRRNAELDKLISEAREKQQELGMLQDMRKEFERTEDIERMNECLKQELMILRQSVENAKQKEDLQSDEYLQANCRIVSCSRCDEQCQKEVKTIIQLKDQLSSTRELTEECLGELRASKEMLYFLRERICSLKRLLKEKSDEMATLQADHQIIKNDYKILKTENGIFEEKARFEIREFRDKRRYLSRTEARRTLNFLGKNLKDVQSQLRLVNDNFHRVSQDFEKSQELLMESAKREVNLQHAITTMEQIYCPQLTSAGNEAKRLSVLVDMLRSDLEDAREEFSMRESDYTKRCRDSYEQIETLEERIAILEQQLQESRRENRRVIAENTVLMENGCQCVKELEETHNALLELKGECKSKTKTLNCVSAELNYVVASRSDLCEESQKVVSCIRSWIEEQQNLVENLRKKLKSEKDRISNLSFERKALVATVRELMRFNGTLSELTLRGKISGLLGRGQNHRCCKLNYNHRPASASQKDERCSTTHTRPLKRCCVCLTRAPKRRFSKHKHVNKEPWCKNHRQAEKIPDGWESEASIDEAPDFGYQSSASK